MAAKPSKPQSASPSKGSGMSPWTYVRTSLRAIYAGVIALLTGLSTALSSDSGFGDITDQQWVFIALGTVVAFGGVWGITNPKK